MRTIQLTVSNWEELPYGAGLNDGMICRIEDEGKDVVWCERWARWIYMDSDGPRIFGKPRR